MRENYSSILFNKNKILIILTLIYLYNFNNLGNSLIRIDSNGNNVLSPLSIIESFIAPLRSILIIIKHGGINQLYKYLKFESTNFANPYFYIILYVLLTKMVYNKDYPYNLKTSHNNYILLDVNI